MSRFNPGSFRGRLGNFLTAGRLRIWWLHHGREARAAATLATLIGCYLFASSMDYQDALAAERAEKEAAIARAHRHEMAGALPRTAIVIDAWTAQDFGLRLSEIAGDLDAERYRVRGMK